MYNSQIVVERIRKIAKEKSISITFLNEKCELSENTISASAKSTYGMKAKNLYMIAEFLGVSVDYLLGRTESPELSHSTSITVNGNNQTSTNGNNNISISEREKLDEMSSELLKKFNELSFDEKLDIFNYIKSKKEI